MSVASAKAEDEYFARRAFARLRCKLLRGVDQLLYLPHRFAHRLVFQSRTKSSPQ